MSMFKLSFIQLLPKDWSPVLDNMDNNDKILKELATPDVIYHLKSRLIHLLPKFHSLASEDSHKHLKEFHVVCSTMRPHMAYTK
ncbi:hypothetical protein CR513_04533, partial [Mucuna pruriens]